MTLKANEMYAAAEAILFASGEPLEIARIAEALQVEIEYARLILQNLSDLLEERGSGLCVLKLNEKYQLCTKPDFADIIREVLALKKNTPLSPAAFEVLAVVAYNQPVTKSYIEQIRGVDCSGVMATLSQKGLIEEKGRLELPGRPLIYGTTAEFLKCFCISSLEELPEIPEKESGKEQLKSLSNNNGDDAESEEADEGDGSFEDTEQENIYDDVIDE